jgi:predicted MPP superfamily phosphohydrolase
MIRLRNISPQDFSHARSYPGTAGNPFDVILQSTWFFARVPDVMLLLLLAGLAFLGGKFDWFTSSIWLMFFAVDWLLISLLPNFGLSFGPVKPVVLILALLRTPFALLPFWWALGFQIIGILLVVYGFYIEPFRLDVHTETMVTGKLKSGEKVKIAHLGDLHIERITRRERMILKALEKASPDLILFSGDVLNLSCIRNIWSQEDARDFLRSLHAPLGVYGVTGSPPVDPPDVYAALIANTPMQWLDNHKARIKVGGSQLVITGLTCSHHPEDDFAAMQRSGLAKPQPDAFNILLYHSPDIAPLVQASGFDLQLSGHTHGGQVRLPFYGAIFAGSLYHKAFEAGRYLLGKMTLYVTRGLGMEGGIAPRVRFLCRPELIIWEINGE